MAFWLMLTTKFFKNVFVYITLLIALITLLLLNDIINDINNATASP